MQQLTKLLMGGTAERAEGNNNNLTINGFKIMDKVLKIMQNLTTVNMQLPHVKKVDISAMSKIILLSLEVNGKGIQFII
jgi:hypothetical protein